MRIEENQLTLPALERSFGRRDESTSIKAQSRRDKSFPFRYVPRPDVQKTVPKCDEVFWIIASRLCTSCKSWLRASVVLTVVKKGFFWPVIQAVICRCSPSREAIQARESVSEG